MSAPPSTADAIPVADRQAAALSGSGPLVAPVLPIVVRKRFLATLAVTLAMAAGSTIARLAAAGRAEAPPLVASGLPVEWEDRFVLEENDRALVVDPRVSVDPLGGFLVADTREAQVRRYDQDGDLVAAIGRRGAGPGEFRHPVAFVRHGGSLVAGEMGGDLSYFDPSGRFRYRRSTAVAPLYAVRVLDDTTLVLVGRRGGDPGLVHLWSTRSERILRSVHPVPPHPAELAGAYAFAGTADVAVRGDTLAAVFALSDTVTLLARDGRVLERIAIPFQGFRPLREPMPRSGSDIGAFQAWNEGFSAISQVFWAADGSLLVQYYDTQGMEPRTSLLGMSRGGERRFERSGTPRLLAADPREPRAYFVDPGAELPNAWSVARLRP